MSNIIRKTTELAMYITSSYTFPGCVIVDATCGNGHDTIALARTKPSRLYAFDIQQEAVAATEKMLVSEGFGSALDNGTISIICDSHSNMTQYVHEPADVIVFNLGYLPGGDKTKPTYKSETVKAARSALELLALDGVLCLTMYSGHPEGLEEKEVLMQMAETLDPKVYHAAYVNFINQKNSPPEILLITKKA